MTSPCDEFVFRLLVRTTVQACCSGSNERGERTRQTNEGTSIRTVQACSGSNEYRLVVPVPVIGTSWSKPVQEKGRH